MTEADNYIPLSERIEAAQAEGTKEINFYGIRINTDIQEVRDHFAGALLGETPLEPETDSLITSEPQI